MGCSATDESMTRAERSAPDPSTRAVRTCRGFLIAAGSLSLVTAGLWVGTATAAVPTVTVPCVGPGGGISGLIAATAAANAGGGGTIRLAGSCTYTLANPDNATDGGNGLPVITAPVTIVGQGGTSITRSSSPATSVFRVFDVHPGGILTLNTLAVTGGNTDMDGGGIFVDGGTLDLTASQVNGNTARSGGGVFGDATGSLNLVDSQISQNTSSGTGLEGGGGIGVTDSSAVTLTRSTVVNNTAAFFGGGMLITGGGNVVARSSKVDRNVSEGNDGGIADGLGSSTGVLTLLNSEVNDNHAFDDGGLDISDGSTATLTWSQVIGNAVVAPEGIAEAGGIGNGGTTSLSRSIVAANTATGPTADGAGVFNRSGGKLTGTYTLVIGNRASGTITDGGGIFNDDGGVVALTNTALAANTASGTTAAGGGIFNNGTVTLGASLVVGNQPENCSPPGSVPGCASGF